MRHREKYSEVANWLAGDEQIRQNVTIAELANSMPDQKGLLTALAASPSEKLSTWARRLRYTDSPALASMWPCILLNDKTLQKHPDELQPDDVAEDRPRKVTARWLLHSPWRALGRANEW